MDRPITIYALRDPCTDEIRYVGRTVQPLHNRLSVHIGDARRHDHHTARWISSLMKVGLRPIIEVIEIATEKTWGERERYHIARLGDEGCDLTNHQEGGLSGGPFISNREAVSKRMKGNNFACGPQSEETRLKKSLAWQGRTNNPGLGGWNKGLYSFSLDRALQLRKEGSTHQSIADELGVSRPTISRVLKETA